MDIVAQKKFLENALKSKLVSGFVGDVVLAAFVDFGDY